MDGLTHVFRRADGTIDTQSLNAFKQLVTLGALSGAGSNADNSKDNSDPLGLGGLTALDPGNLFSTPTPPQASSTGASTISLTASSTSGPTSAAASATSRSSAASASSTSASSAASSTSGSATSTSATPTASTSGTAASSDVSQGPTGTFTLTVSDSQTATATSASSSATVGADNTSTSSFMQNKPLSISVITISSIVGLILLLCLATLAIRKSRKNRLHDLVEDLTPDQVSGPTDVEKGVDAARVLGVSRMASNGSSGYDAGRGAGGSYGGSSQQVGMGRGPQMYERTGYPAFVPTQPPYGQPQPYGRPQQRYAPTTYAQPQEYSNLSQPLPNPFDDPVARVPPIAIPQSQEARAVGPASARRKPAPPLLQTNIPSMTSPASAGSQHSEISLNASPVKLASDVNPANPMPATTFVDVALSGTSHEDNSAVKGLPSPVQMSSFAPLELSFTSPVPEAEEAGASTPVEKPMKGKAPRTLKVVNA